MIGLSQLYDVVDHTWPAARRWDAGNWTLREGQGGGQRVSAATALGAVQDRDIDAAEAEMRAMGQRPIFQMRGPDDAALDALLDARGYEKRDATNLYIAPIDLLTDREIPRVTAFAIWEPLAIMNDLWVEAGVGPERFAVMERAAEKTGVLARWNEQPGGVAFAGLHDGVCMVHCVEVRTHQRRQGVAGWLMRKAAFWAQSHGASHISVLCVDENVPANALYRALGFTQTGQYHYRRAPN